MPAQNATDTITEALAEASLQASPVGGAPRLSRDVRGIVLAVLSALTFGLSGTVSKFLMESYSVDPLWLATMRPACSCWLFLVACLVRPRARKQIADLRRNPRALLTMVAYGAVAILFSQLGYLEAIHWTDSATATVIEECFMIFVLAFVCATEHRAPRRRDCAGVVLALAGVYLLATGGSLGTLQLPVQGLAWGLVAALASALISILPGKLLAGWDNFVTNGMGMLACGVTLTMVVRPWQIWPALDAFGVACTVFVVVVGTFVSYALYVQSVRDLGPVRASFFTPIEPVCALVSSVVWLGASFAPTDLAGMALITVMIFLTA